MISPHTPDLYGAGTTIPLLVSGMTPPEVHVRPSPAPPHLAFELPPRVDSGLSLLPNPAVHHQHPTSTSALTLTYPFPSCSSEGKAEARAAQGGVVRPRGEPVLPEPSCAPCPIPQRREEQVWSHRTHPPPLSARWRQAGRRWARPPIQRAILILDPNRLCWGNSPRPCAQYCGPCPSLETAAWCPA